MSEISVALTGGCSSAVIQLAANPRAGPFKMALCSYMPGEPILKQTWQPPTVKKCTSFWHKADMQRCAANVRFRGKRTSLPHRKMSAYDPSGREHPGRSALAANHGKRHGYLQRHFGLGRHRITVA